MKFLSCPLEQATHVRINYDLYELGLDRQISKVCEPPYSFGISVKTEGDNRCFIGAELFSMLNIKPIKEFCGYEQ